MKQKHKIGIIFMVFILYSILINFSGRYMGFKDLENILEGRVNTVLLASDICLEEDLAYVVDRQRDIYYCMDPDTRAWKLPDNHECLTTCYWAIGKVTNEHDIDKVYGIGNLTKSTCLDYCLRFEE